jgi:hypothetical protein
VFLRLKRDQLKIIGFDYQLVVKKTTDSARFATRPRLRATAQTVGSGVALNS